MPNTRFISLHALFALSLLVALLALPMAASAAEIRTVVLDPGHGGYDSGLKPEDLKEKEQALKLATELTFLLEAMDKRVFLTRKIDTYMSLDERQREAAKKQPELFISIHMTKSDRFGVYHTWYRQSEKEIGLAEFYSIRSRQRRNLYGSKLFAVDLENALKQELGASVSRTQMSLRLLDTVGAPAVLLEVPFNKVRDPEEVTFLISAIVKAILDYEQRQ